MDPAGWDGVGNRPMWVVCGWRLKEASGGRVKQRQIDRS